MQTTDPRFRYINLHFFGKHGVIVAHMGTPVVLIVIYNGNNDGNNTLRWSGGLAHRLSFSFSRMGHP